MFTKEMKGVVKAKTKCAIEDLSDEAH